MEAVIGLGRIDRQTKTAVRWELCSADFWSPTSRPPSTAGLECFDMVSRALVVLLKPIVKQSKTAGIRVWWGATLAVPSLV